MCSIWEDETSENQRLAHVVTQAFCDEARSKDVEFVENDIRQKWKTLLGEVHGNTPVPLVVAFTLIGPRLFQTVLGSEQTDFLQLVLACSQFANKGQMVESVARYIARQIDLKLAGTARVEADIHNA